jgi:hypothetical protein
MIKLVINPNERYTVLVNEKIYCHETTKEYALRVANSLAKHNPKLSFSYCMADGMEAKEIKL